MSFQHDKRILHGDMVDYEKTVKEMKQTGAAWEDPYFPQEEPLTVNWPRVEWRRPEELSSDAKMFNNGTISWLDPVQGPQGSQEFQAALAALATKHKGHLTPSFPDEEVDLSVGIVRFRFTRFGEQQEVYVDTRLPCFRVHHLTQERELRFTQGANNVFWPALLEKAYAKLIGGYEELLKAGMEEILTDLTGGLVEHIYIPRIAPDDLSTTTKRALQRNGMVVAYPGRYAKLCDPGRRIPGINYDIEKETPHVVKHFTKVHVLEGKEVELVQMVLPIGKDGKVREWTGAWSDQSQEWKTISDAEKRQIQLDFNEDGQFWMSLDDFRRVFERVYVLSMSTESSTTSTHALVEERYHGFWANRGGNAGGPPGSQYFENNPHYEATVHAPKGEEKGILVVSLIQKGPPSRRVRTGLRVFKLEDFKAQMETKIARIPVAKKVPYSPTGGDRDQTLYCELDPGQYVIVPWTAKEMQEAKFYLRVFTSKFTEAGEAVESVPEYKRQELSAEEKRGYKAKFWPIYQKVAGVDEQMDAYELRALLTASFRKDMGNAEFPLASANAVISTFSEDGDYKLNFDEFCRAMHKIRQITGVFEEYDTDKSGSFNTIELRSGLKKLGFRLSQGVLDLTAVRFTNKKGEVSIPEFIQIVMRLEKLKELEAKYFNAEIRKTAFTKDELYYEIMGV